MSQAILTPTKRVRIELLYLDAETCDPCRATVASAERAAQELREALADRGIEVELDLTHVTDPVQARALGFVSSPTVRVDAREIALGVQEAHCGTCSANAGEPVACRTVSYEGERLDHTPTAMIVEAVLAHLRGGELPLPPAVDEDADAPTSVERYLRAIERQGPAHLELRGRLRGEVLGPARRVGSRRAPPTTPSSTSGRRWWRYRPTPRTWSRSCASPASGTSRWCPSAPATTPSRWSRSRARSCFAPTGCGRWRSTRRHAWRGSGRRQVGGPGPDRVRPRPGGAARLTPDVSIAGFSLGGGVGWYARALGLATNSVTRIEIVTADARRRWVDHDHEPELFWALRGGGGNFGVVTALEFRLYDMPELYAGVLFYPWTRSAEVLHAWNAGPAPCRSARPRSAG